MRFAVVVDEAIDYPPELERLVKVYRVPATLKLDGEDLSFASYDEVVDKSEKLGKLPRPGIAPPGRFLSAYRELGEKFPIILSVHTTGKISGMINSARSAKNMYRGPAQVYIVDSGSSSLLAGLSLLDAVSQYEDPLKIKDAVPEIAGKGAIIFYLKRVENLERIRPIQGIKRIIKGEISLTDAIKMAKEKESGFILTLTEGKIKLLDIIKDENEAIKALVNHIEGKKVKLISAGYVMKEKEAGELRERLLKKTGISPFIIKMSRLVYAGTGPNLFGFAYLEA